MIRSMTGFGRSEMVTETHKIIVEMKSINHRYSELFLKTGRKLISSEIKIRNVLKEYIKRGKADIFIIYEEYSTGSSHVRVNESLAKEYFDCCNLLSEKFAIKPVSHAMDLVRFQDILIVEESKDDPEEIWKLIEPIIREAAQRLVDSRIIEGSNLNKDIEEKLYNIEKGVNIIEEQSPEIVKSYREKLTAKVSELLGQTQLDESILATEITVYADKTCVDEETVRLKSHIAQIRNTILENEPVGRKLDFIVQELNREANTILSKISDTNLSNIAIEIKTEIEKLREQIQNIE